MSNIWCRRLPAAVAVAFALAIAPTLAAQRSTQTKTQARVQLKKPVLTKKTQARTAKRPAITATTPRRITTTPSSAAAPAAALALTGNLAPKLNRGGCYKPLAAFVTKTFMPAPPAPGTLTFGEPPPSQVCNGVKVDDTMYNAFPTGAHWCLTCGSGNQLSDGSCLGMCNAGFLFKAAGGGQCCKGIDPRPDVDLQKYKTK